MVICKESVPHCRQFVTKYLEIGKELDKFLDFSERSHWPGVIPGLGNAAPELGVTISRDVTLVTFVT